MTRRSRRTSLYIRNSNFASSLGTQCDWTLCISILPSPPPSLPSLSTLGIAPCGVPPATDPPNWRSLCPCSSSARSPLPPIFPQTAVHGGRTPSYPVPNSSSAMARTKGPKSRATKESGPCGLPRGRKMQLRRLKRQLRKPMTLDRTPLPQLLRKHPAGRTHHRPRTSAHLLENASLVLMML